MGKSEIRKECFKVQQGGLEFYVFIVGSKELRAIADVSRRDADNRQGYQRYLSDSRLKEVGAYIKKPRATFPNSIILNLAPKKAKFEQGEIDGRGTLVVSTEGKAAWVIDGQHRLFGFEHAEGKEFDLLVAAFIGLNTPDQATVFKVINSTQKGVSPSLIYDLIDLTRDAEYVDGRAHEIVKALNSEEDSPWYQQVKMLGVGKGIISQAGFIGELGRLLQDPIFKEYPVGEQVKIIKDYYGALRNLFPDAWASKKHVLCKTIGLSATIRIMPKVLILCTVRNDLSSRMMGTIMKNLCDVDVPTAQGMERIDWSGPQLGVFGGRAGQHRLATLLEKALPQVRPTHAGPGKHA